MTRRDELLALAERISAEKGYSNELDVQAEIALFEPDETFLSIRANAAGTKVIYQSNDGREMTCWARNFTRSRASRSSTATALRALAEREREP